jgi:hypothetical protein
VYAAEEQRRIDVADIARKTAVAAEGNAHSEPERPGPMRAGG